MSFVEELQNYIFNNGTISFNEMKSFAEQKGHKVSYAERLLRRLAKTGKIAIFKNKKGVVVGYARNVLKTLEKPILSPTEHKKSINLKELKTYKQLKEDLSKMSYDENGRLIVKF